MDAIKGGKGYPNLLSDEMVIPFDLANGASRREANDWNISGCCENRSINRETNVTANGGFNYGPVTEMTFRNGRLKVWKDLKFGVETGDPRTWASFDDVWKAFITQLEYLVRHSVCPTGALYIFGHEMSVDEVLAQVEEDGPFLR